jgi:hypothetical protein
VEAQALRSLGVPPRGIVQIHTPSTGPRPQASYQYDVSLTFFLPKNMTFSLYALPVVAASLADQGQGVEVLIGRDVLAHGLLVYDGQLGVFSLAF